jgi:hypothetical protein
MAGQRRVGGAQVPVGGEEAARVLKVVGEPRAFDFPVQDHLALGESLDLLDFETGAISRWIPPPPLSQGMLTCTANSPFSWKVVQGGNMAILPV